MNKNKSYKLNYLSEAFYAKYNSTDYPEIEHKIGRPYMVMLIKINDNTFAVPFRTNIKHKQSYKFKSTDRATNSSTGLDFTKAVIVNNISYIGTEARIGDKEYIELDTKHYIIIKRFKKYVDDYIKLKNSLLPQQVAVNYKYSTLKYFHRELGIDKA